MRKGFLIVVAVAALLAAGCGEEPAGTTDGAETELLPRIDLAGIERLIAEADAQDRVLVIDFWATWCVPCVEMFPGLHAGLKDLGDPVLPVTITLDAPGRLEAAAIAFLKTHHAMKNAYLLEPDSDAQLAVIEKIGPNWNDLVVPAIFVFDPDGRLAGEFLGAADPDEEVRDILGRVRELLSDNSPTEG